MAHENTLKNGFTVLIHTIPENDSLEWDLEKFEDFRDKFGKSMEREMISSIYGMILDSQKQGFDQHHVLVQFSVHGSHSAILEALDVQV